MIKFIIQDDSIFYKLSNIKFLNYIFEFDLSNIHSVKSVKSFNKILYSIRMSNGTFKTTAINRFKSINTKILKYFSNDIEYKILDVAASDGSTTVELLDFLQSHGIKSKLHFSDKYSKLYQSGNGFIKRFYDSDKKFLFAYIGKIYVNPYLTNKYILSKLLGKFSSRTFPHKFEKEILLINPIAQKYISENKIAFFNQDILKACKETDFHYIRCMNILNKGNFDDKDLIIAIDHLNTAIKDGGVLQIGRTSMNSANHNVSFYQKRNNELHWIEDINEGYEGKTLIPNKISLS